MTREELLVFINKNLHVGDDDKKIVSFLKSQEWPYVYDPYNKSYYTRNPAEDSNKIARNQILIYVDDSKTFVRAEVETWYAAP